MAKQTQLEDDGTVSAGAEADRVASMDIFSLTLLRQREQAQALLDALSNTQLERLAICALQLSIDAQTVLQARPRSVAAVDWKALELISASRYPAAGTELLPGHPVAASHAAVASTVVDEFSLDGQQGSLVR